MSIGISSAYTPHTHTHTKCNRELKSSSLNQTFLKTYTQNHQSVVPAANVHSVGSDAYAVVSDSDILSAAATVGGIPIFQAAKCERGSVP